MNVYHTQVYCTRPGCPNPRSISQNPPQKFCIHCGMNLILNNRFIATDILANGGFGRLFMGIDTNKNNQQCVIKQLQFNTPLTTEERDKVKELFKREAEALKQLGSHPQIPQLFDDFDLKVTNTIYGTHEFSYIVEEYVDGDTLQEELETKGKVTERKILDLLQQILPILSFIHAQNHIHRDIKPSNIKKNSQGVIYLLDFGAIKLENNPLQNQQNKKINTRIYTTGYAPPEQQKGENIYPSTDLYALAVTCIELLTGKNPDQLYDNYNDTWIWQNDAKVHYLLESVLNKMLESKPEKRFQSAAEVLKALELLINQYNTGNQSSGNNNTNTNNTNTNISSNNQKTVNNFTPKQKNNVSLSLVQETRKSLFKASFLGVIGALIGTILLKILTINLLPIIIFIWLVIDVPIVWFKNRYESILNKIYFLILGTVSTGLAFYVLKEYLILWQTGTLLTFGLLSIAVIIISCLFAVIGLLIYELFDIEK